MKNRMSRVQWSASALAMGFVFACGGSTPPAEAPEQPAAEAAPAAEPAAAPAAEEEKAVPGPIVVNTS